MPRVGNKVLVPAKTADGRDLSKQLISQRVGELVRANIQPFYGEWNGDPKTAPIFVEVKFGAFMVYSLVLSKLSEDFPTVVGAIRAKSYRKNGVRTSIRITNPMFDCRLKGRRVLIIDDIVESGQTVAALKQWFTTKGAADIRTFALLDKPSKREFDVEIDWVGFQLEPDQWVVGFGLDDNLMFRHFNNVVVAVDKPRIETGANKKPR